MFRDESKNKDSMCYYIAQSAQLRHANMKNAKCEPYEYMIQERGDDNPRN